jgi:integrase
MTCFTPETKMAKRAGLTVKAIENLQPRGERYEVPDPGCPGLYLQIHPTGVKSWAYRYRIAGKSHKLTIGTAYTDNGIEVIKLGDARDITNEARVSVAKQIDPATVKKEKSRAVEQAARASENTLRAIAEKYLDQPEHKRLRTIDQRRDVFERLIFPVLGSRLISSVKRSEIVDMLDEIANSSGPVMADRALATLSRLFSWHAARSDDFASPLVRGMSRTSTKERSRTRTLTEAEIRALWGAADEAGIFGSYLQFLLLTATRRNEAARMRRSEIEADNWTIPAIRYKNKLDHVIPLSGAAVSVLGRIPKISRSDFIFTADGKGPITGFGCRKETFDRAMLTQLRKLAEEAGEDPARIELQRWTIHDLRRTARTLLSQAGVSSEHAEACMGHVKRGVEATYDRYQYHSEKRVAFAKLADLVECIINPAANVIPFSGARR